MMVTFKSDVKKRKQLFTAESFAHPAKMHLGMLLWVIGKYTKPGETILDPMFGSGSTMLAARYGRNVIGVELEQKFVDMAKGNWDKVRSLSKTKFELGECRVIQGDARNLGGLLADAVVTSPPFGDTNHPTNYLGKQKGESGFEYSDDLSNIGNLLYGQVDAVLTSPPYAETFSVHAGGNMRLTELGRKTTDLSAEEKQEAKELAIYSRNESNISNLPYGQVDSVITSPPFQEADIQRPGKAQSVKDYDYGSKQKHQGQSPENIVNLAERYYGDISAIITSPPYENVKVPPHTAEGEAKRLEIARERGVSPDKVSYMDYTKVDKIITSPPYAEAVHSTNQSVEHLVNKGIKPSIGSQIFSMEHGYSEEKDNIGNLSYGSVDSIISSPPYEATFNEKQHTLSGIAKRDPAMRVEVGGYSGGVEAVISSPPYENQEHKGSGEWSQSSEGRLLGGEQSNGGKMLGVPQGEDYTKTQGNIGNLRSSTYLEAMLQVYQQCYKVLKPNGLMILVTKDFIRKGQRILLSIDTIALCEQAGFAYEDWHQRKLTQQSFWRRNYYKKHPEVERLDTEDILVFRKLGEGGMVDTIVSSPPYSNSPTGGGLNTKPSRKGRNDQSGRSPSSPSQIGAGEYDGAKINDEWIKSRQAVK